MGYHKNLEVEQQDKIDRIVRWYREHSDIVPSYMMGRILADGDLVDELVERWEEIPAPVPASQHVALRERPAKPKRDYSMTSGEGKLFISIYITTMSLVLVAAVLLAVL